MSNEFDAPTLSELESHLDAAYEGRAPITKRLMGGLRSALAGSNGPGAIPFYLEEVEVAAGATQKFSVEVQKKEGLRTRRLHLRCKAKADGADVSPSCTITSLKVGGNEQIEGGAVPCDLFPSDPQSPITMNFLFSPVSKGEIYVKNGSGAAAMISIGLLGAR